MTQNEHTEHEPFVDADDTHDPVNEELTNHDGPRNQGEKVADDFKRIATDAAHAAAGFAGFLGDKAREFYDEQRKQYVEAHPESEDDPESRQFLNHIRDKFNAFFEDLGKGYKDMADRGAQYFKSEAEEAEEAAADLIDDLEEAADDVVEDITVDETFVGEDEPADVVVEEVIVEETIDEEPRHGE